MPKKVHNKLARAATKKGLSGKKKNAYIYSTLKKIDKHKKETGFYQ